MARRRSFGGRKTDYTWQGNAGVIALATNASGLVTINSPESSSTITRSRGQVLASLDGGVDTSAAVVAMGLIVVTEEQLAVGVTAIPDPASDLDAEWIWYGFGCLGQEGSDLAQVGHSVRLEIDSKAMRRIKQTQHVVFVATNTSFVTSAPADVIVGVRQLFGA